MQDEPNRQSDYSPDPQWEERVRQTAQRLRYPPTPHLVQPRQTRRTTSPRLLVQLASVALILLVAIVSLTLAVPQTRASLINWLRIGGVSIEVPEQAPATSTAARTVESAQPNATAEATPVAIPTAPLRRLDLAGETTLAIAARELGFPLYLPTIPNGIGPPDRTFLQQTAGPVVIMAWMSEEAAEQPKFLLYQMRSDVHLFKGEPPVLRETQVNGQPAAWVQDGHYLRTADDNYEYSRFIDGNVLIWTRTLSTPDRAEITYRLETTLSEEAAIRMAESLAEWGE